MNFTKNKNVIVFCLMSIALIFSSIQIVYANTQESVIARESPCAFFINGEELSFVYKDITYSPIILDDTNYIPVPIAEMILKKSVNVDGYNDEYLTSNEYTEFSYTTATSIENITVKIDGESHTIHKILICDNVMYLPIRAICELGNMKIHYDAVRCDILIRDSISISELEDAENYVNKIDLKIKTLWNTIDNIYATKNIIEGTTELKTTLDAISNIRVPNIKYIKFIHNEQKEIVNEMYNDLDKLTKYDETIIRSIEFKLSSIQYYISKAKRFNF